MAKKRTAKGKGGVPKIGRHQGGGLRSSDHQWVKIDGDDVVPGDAPTAAMRKAIDAGLAKHDREASVSQALDSLVDAGLVEAQPDASGDDAATVYRRLSDAELTPAQRAERDQLLGFAPSAHRDTAEQAHRLDELVSVRRPEAGSEGNEMQDKLRGAAEGYNAGAGGPIHLTDPIGVDHSAEFDIRPASVVEERDLLAAWWASPTGSSAAETWHVTSMQHGQYPAKLSDVEVMAAYQSGRRWAQAEAGLLAQATPYHVSPEMTELVWHASRSMDAQPLHRDDLPTARGFVWLGQPLTLPDSTAAAFWQEIWHSRDTTRYTPGMIRAISWASVDLAAGTNVGAFEGARANDHGGLAFAIYGDHSPSPRLALYDHGAFLFGVDYDDDPARRGAVNLLRFVQALWAIMDQTITVQRRELPDRPTRRRIVRMGRVPEPVIVVTLRRARLPEGEQGASPVAWSHRWLVGGHWRRIRHPRTGEQRQVWVSPHLKGPVDKPIVWKERVYDLRR